jgi:hypothetical protein
MTVQHDARSCCVISEFIDGVNVTCERHDIAATSMDSVDVGAADALETEPPELHTTLSDITLCDASDTALPFTALAQATEPLYLHGLSANGDRVTSDAVGRWFVDYGGTEGPMMLVQTSTAHYKVPVTDAIANEAYAELWLPLVRSVKLAAAVLAAGQRREKDVWAAAAPHLTVEEQVAEWPFVREVLRVLGVLRHVRRPGNLAEVAPVPPVDAATSALLEEPRQTRLKRAAGDAPGVAPARLPQVARTGSQASAGSSSCGREGGDAAAAAAPRPPAKCLS